MADEAKDQKTENSNQETGDSTVAAADDSAADDDTKGEPKEAKSGTDKSSTPVPAKFKKLVEEVEQLSVLELSELVKVLEDRFGVSAAAPVAVAAAPAGGGGGEAEEASEKAEFNVVLKDAGAKKIDVIKAVREISGLGLAESKAVADGAPKTVVEKVKKEEAEEAKTKLEAAGATVELE
jgi:large subunit ribosomal protein L7/L12